MEFLLEPDVVFLNHGSFGACPRPVHEHYQRLQVRLERQPVRFLQRELPDLLQAARASLAGFLGAAATDVVFVPNPTYAVNEIVRSLRLGPGDDVVTTDHEYGACRNAWDFMAERARFTVVEVPVPVPTGSDAEIVERLWAGVTSRTKVLFLSHITSPTALTMPVTELCRRARAAGVLSIVDGAHGPGQLDLDLAAVGADIYVGTCHKWMCAPKGAAFLHARPDVQPAIEPLVVGWGWGRRRAMGRGSDFLDAHEWLGTHDPAAYLAVPAAIDFLTTNDWPAVRARCHALAVAAADRAATVPGVARIHPRDDSFAQMAVVELTGGGDAAAIKSRLYDEHRVEVPVTEWNGRLLVRASIQAYNTAGDVDALVAALADVARR